MKIGKKSLNAPDNIQGCGHVNGICNFLNIFLNIFLP